MAFRSPRADRQALLAWLAGAFAVSAVTDARVLAGLLLLAVVVLHRGAARHLRRVALVVLPLTLGLTLASWAWRAWLLEAPVDWAALLAVNLRAVLLTFLTLAVLARVDLFRALAPWPSATRLLAITLAQIHALRLVARESREALRSRTMRRPRMGELVRSAGTLTGTLFTLAAQNARDVTDALRSRGA